MKRTITSDQIAAALKQEELGIPLEDVLRQAGVSEHTFLDWKKRYSCLLYTSPSPRDQRGSRMPSSA